MWIKAEEFLKKDDYLGVFVDKYGSCTIKKSSQEEYFKNLVESIANQQLSGKAAATIFSRVCNLLSNITPESVLSKKDEELRQCGLSWSKVAFIKDLSNKIIAKEIDLKNINKLTNEEIIKELVKVKGIGKWTAEMFLMFSLCREDIFPLDDLGIQKGIEKLVNSKLNKKEMEEFSLMWKPYRTVASWYLWRITEDKEV
jgi:DNA-3-methyladenine glycosylase II